MSSAARSTGAPLPTGSADDIASWLDSAAMTTLLDAFDFQPPATASLAARLAAIDTFSKRWDYRQGLERYQAEGEEFPPELDALIRTTTAALGLAGREKPQLARYDHVLVLGGGVRTMLARAALAASVLRSGVETSAVAGLGSLRPLSGQEEAVRQFGLRPCPTEGDAVDEALRREFTLADTTGHRSGPDWWVRSYDDANPPVHVIAAPSRRPGLRANTADTFIGWAEHLPVEPRGARLLLVTTDLFVPFQHCDAVRLLGLTYDATVDTIGFATATSSWVRPARTFEVLQEVRAAVRSTRALHEALA